MESCYICTDKKHRCKVIFIVYCERKEVSRTTLIFSASWSAKLWEALWFIQSSAHVDHNNRWNTVSWKYFVIYSLHFNGTRSSFLIINVTLESMQKPLRTPIFTFRKVKVHFYMHVISYQKVHWSLPLCFLCDLYMIPSNIDYVAKHIFIWNIYSNIAIKLLFPIPCTLETDQVLSVCL